MVAKDTGRNQRMTDVADPNEYGDKDPDDAVDESDDEDTDDSE